MIKNFVKKSLVTGIIILCIGTCFLPNLVIKAGVYEPNTIEIEFINSPPTAPMDTSDTIVDREIVLKESFSAVILDNVPTSKWTYGCSPTAAGMLFGYYDRKGYNNMYTGPANSGICPQVNLGQGTPDMGNGYPISGSCHIIATEMNLDGITSKAHVDDYWISYGSPGPDPWEGNWTEHTWGLCLADFIGTSQWKWDSDLNGTKDKNNDGSTRLFLYSDGTILYDYIPPAAQGLPQTALCHGLKLFAQSRGYTVNQNYVQRTNTPYGHPSGFTFNAFQGEINAGRPVLTHWVTSSGSGHSMLAIGYDSSASTIFIHDTWDNNLHEVSWNGNYSDFNLKAVIVFQMASSGNNCPNTPNTPQGTTNCNVNQEYIYSTSTIDPDGDQVKYGWDWNSDGVVDEWTTFNSSGSPVNTSHIWTLPGTYDIQVKARDTGDAMSDWSDTLTVQVINNPPNPPSNPNPVNGATNVNINSDISWSCSDPDGDDLVYDVYFEKDDSTPDILVSNDQTAKTFNPGTLDYGATYYWKIIAKDVYGETTTGPVWHFTTEIKPNSAPEKPARPSGQTQGNINVGYIYSSFSNDPDGDQVFYWFDWDDDTNSGWDGPYSSGISVSVKHTWYQEGGYQIKVKAKDTFGAESAWSDPLSVTMPRAVGFRSLLLELLERFPNMFPILRQFMKF